MKAFFCVALLAMCALSLMAAVIGAREHAHSISPVIDTGDAKRFPSIVTGRFTGVYQYKLMDADWFFPCDGTQALQVKKSRKLFHHAESVNQRFPSASIRRNGVYLTALGTLGSTSDRRDLDVHVILSMSPDHPANCRTPERDHAMAMPPPLPAD
jgi:hypothetical protein